MATPDATRNGRSRPDEHVADGLDRGALRPVRLRLVGEVVLVGEVDDGVGAVRALPEAVEVVEVAAQRGRPLGLDGDGRRVGTREADDLVPGAEQLVDGGGPDPAGRAGDENTHGDLLPGRPVSRPADVSH
jgi:hypothetical protein